MLTPRWTLLNRHETQVRYLKSQTRFNVVPSGRRSGKTEIAKRRLVEKAIAFTAFPDGWFIASAPTHGQAKRLFWKDLKALVPPELISGKIREGELTIPLYNGAEISVVGLDAPERVEGRPIDHIELDEYGNMKESVWPEHVRPALSNLGRPGTADFTGVPEGRNHYYHLFKDAQADESGEWDTFHWFSADILEPREIESAKGTLDRLTYEQEYEGSFVSFSGRAYYPFSQETHVIPLVYNPELDLIFCFDFNVAPGVAVVVQEQKLEGVGDKNGLTTCVIGEVHIPQNSNTPAVCRKLIADWQHHKGRVLCYGDATGGARGSAKVEGSDWELIAACLKPAFPSRIAFRVKKANPPERVRVNAMNSRLQSHDNSIHLMVDKACKQMILDFEGVTLLEGGSGEIDKKIDPKATHLTDALGYYVERAHPTRIHTTVSVQY